MLQQQSHAEPREAKWTCQGQSPIDEPCDATATHHCAICGRWFCAVHADDEAWHHCALGEGDHGGES